MAYNLIGQHTIERDGRQVRLYGDGVTVNDPMNFVIGDVNQVPGKRSSKIFNWRLPHKVELSVIDYNGQYADLIRDESPTKFKMELDDPQGNLIYKGYVATKLGDYQFHQNVVSWTLTTYDGISVLKSEPIENAFSSEITLGESLRTLLNKVGHNIPTRIITNYDHIDSDSGLKPELIKAAWGDIVKDVESPSYYKLLQRLLEFYKLRLCQSDAIWYIQQRKLLWDNTWTIAHYPADTSEFPYEVTDSDHIIDIPHDPSGTSYTVESKENTIPGIISYKREQVINYPPFRTINGKFEEGLDGWYATAGNLDPPNMSITGNTAVCNDNGSMEQLIKAPVKPNDTVEINFDSRIYIDRPSLSEGVEYEIPLANIWLADYEMKRVRYLQLSEKDGKSLRYKWSHPDELWELQYDSNDDEYNWVNVGAAPGNYRGISFNFYKLQVGIDVPTDPYIESLEVDIPDISGYEDYFIIIDYDPYSEGILNPNPYTNYLFHLNHFYVVPSNISNNAKAVSYIGNNRITGDGQELDESYVFGDLLPKKITIDTRYKYVSGNYLPSFSWKPDQENIHKRIIREVAEQGARPQRTLELDLAYLGSAFPKLHQCVQFDNSLYEVQRVRHSVANRKYQVYLVEISENIIDELNELYSEGDSGTTAINTDAQSSREQALHIDNKLENYFGNQSVTTTTGQIGHLVTSIPIQSIGESIIKSGDPIYVLGRDGIPVMFTVNADVGANDSSIQVQEKPIERRIPSGAKVLYTGKEIKSFITQNANAIALKAPSILVDTDIFRDADWNGEIDSNGNITTFASDKDNPNPSFAMTGRGHFEYTNGSTAWRYKGGNFEFLLGNNGEISNADGDFSLTKNGLDLKSYDTFSPAAAVTWSSPSNNIGIQGLFRGTKPLSYALHLYADETIIEEGPLRLVPLSSPISDPESNPSSGVFIFVDSADGDLKVRFTDGTTKTLATN